MSLRHIHRGVLGWERPAVGTYKFYVTALKTGLTMTAEHDVVVQELSV